MPSIFFCSLEPLTLFYLGELPPSDAARCCKTAAAPAKSALTARPALEVVVGEGGPGDASPRRRPPRNG